MKKTSKRETAIVTCSCKDCLQLPLEERPAGYKDEFIKVFYPGLGTRYLLPDHAEIKHYGMGNDTKVHKEAKHGFRAGFELEGTFPSLEAYGAALCGLYNFEPTSDSSIWCDEGEIAVELNTPVYRNFSGLQSLFRSLEKAGFCTVCNNTGHHVNISHADMDIHKIRQALIEIYNFGRWLEEHPDICEKCFGRVLNNYARPSLDLMEHYGFINLSNNNRVEFRLCKFNNARQYYLTFCLCIDLMKTLMAFGGTDKQDQITRKLIRHCERHAAGEKSYIKRQTDKYAHGTK